MQVSPDKSPKVQDELKEAFEMFNRFADNLSSSYHDLEERVSQLNAELAAARHDRLQELVEKERLASRLTNLLDALPAGVVVIDGMGRVQECNPAALDLVGEPLEGELWRDIIDRAFLPDSASGSEAVLRDNRMVSISTCPMGNEPGQIILLVDVTETRSLQNALERYKRLSAMGEMTAKLAHQIRTPLASALLYASHLNKNQIQDEDRKRYSERMMSRLKHLESVVEDMLAFTRGGGAGQSKIQITDLLDDLQQAMESHLDNAGCRLYVQHEAEDVAIFANKDALSGVLQNLVNNAIQACGEEGILWLRTRCSDNLKAGTSVDIILRDNGPGISSEDKERIFDPFYTTRPQGTGLGLAVAQAVVQAIGGTIWIESTSSDGTTFVIRLPLFIGNTPMTSDQRNNQQEKLERSAV